MGKVNDALIEYLTEKCNFRTVNGKDTWECCGFHNTRQFFYHLGYSNKKVETELKKLQGGGMYCDCEVVFNL